MEKFRDNKNSSYQTSVGQIARWFFWFPIRIFVSFLPLKVSYLLAKFLADIYFICPNNKRRRMIRNLSLAFRAYAVRQEAFGNEFKEKRIKNIAKREFEIHLKARLEVLLYPTFNKRNIGRIVSRIEGLENLDQALSEGKGAILVIGHFGSNQLIPVILGLMGYPMTQLGYRPPPRKQSKMEQRLFQMKLRCELAQLRYIYTSVFLREAFRLLKRNEILVMTGDGRQGSKFLPIQFLGHKMLFPHGAFALAAKTKAALLPTFIVRENRDKHRIIIKKPLVLQHTGDEDADIVQNIIKFAQLLESYIHKYPCHWHFWDKFSDLIIT